MADDSGIRVVYSDLNLSTPAGVKALYSRIQAAAVHYCEPARITTGTRITSGYDLCVRDAVALAVRKVNVPGLTALHADRSGGSRKG